MTRLAAAVLLALTLSAPSALACINDSEVELGENEFRSRYGEKVEPTRRGEPVELGLSPLAVLGALAIGGALYRASRRPSP